MAERPLADTATGGIRGLWQEVPRVAQIGVIYLLARLVTTGFFLLAAQLSTTASRWGENPTLRHFVLAWDGQWYWSVAYFGYPSVLPLTPGGVVGQNAWAFMPVYAYAAEWLGKPFGHWGFGALMISLVSGYLACLVLFRMLRPCIGVSASMWAVTFFAFGPLAALFQIAYAESLFLLLLFLALYAVDRRRYWWLYPLIPVMAFTRPGILAFALFLGLYGIVRWFRRRQERLAASEVVHIVALGALATICGFAWQVIAGIVTGRADAYIETELAWRRGWGSGHEGFVPVQGWIDAAVMWMRRTALPEEVGYIALGLLLLAMTLVLFHPTVRKLGVNLRLWSASYLIYLVLVFYPQSSTFRLLVPLSPLWGAVALPKSRVYRWSVLALCLLGQALWIWATFTISNPAKFIP